MKPGLMGAGFPASCGRTGTVILYVGTLQMVLYIPVGVKFTPTCTTKNDHRRMVVSS